MRKIAVVGIGTNVGKTIVSAILCHALNADYWKPVQCGLPPDRNTIKKLLRDNQIIHEDGLFLKTPSSPHFAAQQEGFTINPEHISCPKTQQPLIIEGCGGIFVPLNAKTLMLDLFQSWDCEWVVVSRHYLGSINHSLLTLNMMQNRNLNIRGIIFNGEHCSATENIIYRFTKIPCIGRLKQEKTWTFKQIQTYAKRWLNKKTFQNAMLI